MRILVTGGAGYIGSHTVAELVDHGHEVTVIDNLSQGHRQALEPFPTVEFYQLSLFDEEALTQIMREKGIESVVHFAAFSLVGQSTKEPLLYYRNNVSGTERLLSAMVTSGVKRIVFSSTAAVYGDPSTLPIPEGARTLPTNPYGETKLAIEKMLRWANEAYAIKSISLRYFNAAGAHTKYPIGEDHRPESHLIPLVLQTALGQREAIHIYGCDYPTPDGSCVRDYIHVMDLASAHRLALEWLVENSGSQVFNLGNGLGFSVREVIEMAERVVGKPIPIVESDRRWGDPAVLVASPERAKLTLGWKQEYPELSDIIRSAWNWHSQHPHGYEQE
ncbi:UDP-glucose 4-epimerase GalE [Alicyclobacillus sp. TC]|uniref:UDP-glucose 4-epimerase n=2 Tax=Alicyclobacillus tolerans TaxID=90970 RepID=A0A1M6W1R6_9BACL|nr:MULTISPECIES: UDP-glucose 4-epimerase GalE [Alicyclobacillus]MDP9729103.1 UDP-glucose 4-epimerase [Alicyclobacillus tengchongensis]QRF24198.1 UDP-glucose 4-epimerase GalE [Alicyclobacillus sp. TC]SHK87684.1 UDP-glucose 4-epimerase [Alicyclobacillus montanus]